MEGRPSGYRHKKPKADYFDGIPIKVRQCLKCNEEFNSQGNRICDKCSIDNLKVGVRVGGGGCHRGGKVGMTDGGRADS